MPKSPSYKVSVSDLDFVIQYLLLMSHSHRGTQGAKRIYVSKERIKLYEAAIRIEDALLNKRDQEFIDTIDRVCLDVEAIMKRSIPTSELARVRTAIRQKRYKNNVYNRLQHEYDATLEYINKLSS